MKYRTLVAALLLALVSLGCARALADPEPEHPSHRERPTAGASVPAAISGADHPGEVIEFKEGERRAEWIQGVLDAEEAQRVADLARRPVRASVGGGVGGDCAQLSAELGLSEQILFRESRCRWDAVNVTGCGGRSCVGPGQVDLGHTYERSPWNPNVPGTCYGLDLSNPADYAECISRLPASAWNG